MEDMKEKIKKEIEDILKTYPGVLREQLDDTNLWYSCEICKDGPKCNHKCTFPGTATPEEYEKRRINDKNPETVSNSERI